MCVGSHWFGPVHAPASFGGAGHVVGESTQWPTAQQYAPVPGIGHAAAHSSLPLHVAGHMRGASAGASLATTSGRELSAGASTETWSAAVSRVAVSCATASLAGASIAGASIAVPSVVAS
jgi:hypothetical protein